MLNERGHEVPDSTPMTLPIGFTPPPTMVEMIRMYIRRELSQAAAQHTEAETFEEAEDFDVEDDPVDPSTPYEAVFDPPPPSPAVDAPQAQAASPAASGPAVPPSSPEVSSPKPP